MGVDSYGHKTPLPDGELLTLKERHLVDLLSQVVKGFAQVYDEDVQRGDAKVTTHSQDMTEVVNHIHDLQVRVLSRAAARRYPDYRLL